MKKLAFLFGLLLCGSVAKAQIPTVVHDPLSFGQAVTNATTAMSQLTTLANMLNVVEENAKRLEKITSVITLVSDVQYIIGLGISTYNTGAYIMNYVLNNKVIDTPSALRYSGTIIYGTDNIIRNTNRLTEMISSTFIASPAERSQMIEIIKNEFEKEEKKLQEVQEQINSELRLQTMQKMMLQSQGLIK